MAQWGIYIWAIWKGRNEYVFEGKHVDPALALFRAKTLCMMYLDHCPLIKRTDRFTHGITLQGTTLNNEYSHHLLP